MIDPAFLAFTQDLAPEHCYRVFRLDARNRVDQADVIQARDDADAIAMVRGLIGNRSLELWDRGRFVGRFDPERVPEAMAG